jgi:ribulose 1,5-bisphosphate carboxylase large subunit-like protein
MPVTVRRIGSKYRIVEPGGGISTTPQGHARDGGGHATRAQALRQMRAMNMHIEGKGLRDEALDPAGSINRFYPEDRNKPRKR